MATHLTLTLLIIGIALLVPTLAPGNDALASYACWAAWILVGSLIVHIAFRAKIKKLLIAIPLLLIAGFVGVVASQGHGIFWMGLVVLSFFLIVLVSIRAIVETLWRKDKRPTKESVN